MFRDAVKGEAARKAQKGWPAAENAHDARRAAAPPAAGGQASVPPAATRLRAPARWPPGSPGWGTSGCVGTAPRKPAQAAHRGTGEVWPGMPSAWQERSGHGALPLGRLLPSAVLMRLLPPFSHQDFVRQTHGSQDLSHARPHTDAGNAAACALSRQTPRRSSHKHVSGRKRGLKIMDVLLPTLNGVVTSHVL